MAWTTTELLADIRRRVVLRDDEADWTDAVLLSLADEELLETVVPRIQDKREDYFVTYTDYAITASQQGYRIPTRALYGVARDVTVIDSTNYGRNLPLLELEHIDRYSALTSVSTDLVGFCVQGDRLMLVPTPAQTSGTLRVRYFRRPGKLIATSAARQITGVSVGTATLTIGAHSFVIGDKVDVIQANPGFDSLNTDLTVASTTATQVIFSSISSDIAVGDWVAPQYQSPIPQIPAELHPVLAQAVAVRIAELLNDPTFPQQYERLERSLERVTGAMTPRVHGEPHKLVNSYSLLRASRRGW